MRIITIVAVWLVSLPAWAQDNMGGAAAGAPPGTALVAPPGLSSDLMGGPAVAPAAGRPPGPFGQAESSGDDSSGLIVAIVLGLVVLSVVVWWFTRKPRLVVGPTSKACPDCAESVKLEAKVCRFCGHRWA